VIVHFVDIGGIVEHHCLKLSFQTYNDVCHQNNSNILCSQLLEIKDMY